MQVLVVLLLATSTAAVSSATSPEDDMGVVTVMCPVVQNEAILGQIRLVVNSEWAPNGVERFLALVDDDFFTDHALYRAVDNFLIQFGITGNPKKQRKWSSLGTIGDDPTQRIAFKPGMLSYAGSGPNSRDTSLFLATSRSEGQLAAFGTQLWETPLGIVTSGMDVLYQVFTGYGDMEEQGGKGPSQQALHRRGNAALKNFPNLAYFSSCSRTDTTPSDRKAVALENMQRVQLSEDPRTDINLINRSGKRMDVYFQPDDPGHPGVFQGSLEPGEAMKQNSYVGHVFTWKEHGAGTVVHSSRVEKGRGELAFHSDL